jgi:hypothetical protein
MPTTAKLYDVSTSQPEVRQVKPDEIDRPWGAQSAGERYRNVERIRKVTQFMDEAFEVPGTNYRVGWDSIIGLVPVVGDLVTAGISAWIIHEANKQGISRWQMMRMLGNVGIDFTIGLIPGLGDLADAVFKANSKNLRILERHLEKQEKRRQKEHAARGA